MLTEHVTSVIQFFNYQFFKCLHFFFNHREFALTVVRYLEVKMLKEALTSVVKTPSDNYTTSFNEITTKIPGM